jgi:N-methylhydantoinase A
MRLDQARAEKALKDIGDSLNLSTQETALGVIKIANAHMERALRVISVERGHDPRDFTLVSFGGAGGLHAADLARSLNIPKVLVPPQAATLSAYGMLMSDVVKDYSQTVMLSGDTPLKDLEDLLEPLSVRGEQEIIQEGTAPENIHLESSLDLRYRGQSFELNVPFGEDVIARFHEIHQHFYGYANPEIPIEIVNLRVRAIGVVEKPNLSPLSKNGNDPSPARMEFRPVRFESGEIDTPFYDGEKLKFGMEIHGPAVVIHPDTTILIHASDHATVDAFLNLIIQVGGDD